MERFSDPGKVEARGKYIRYRISLLSRRLKECPDPSVGCVVSVGCAGFPSVIGNAYDSMQ